MFAEASRLEARSGEHWTAVGREWAGPADVARCRLCPAARCYIRGTGRTRCTVIVLWYVPPGEAALVSLTGGKETGTG